MGTGERARVRMARRTRTAPSHVGAMHLTWGGFWKRNGKPPTLPFTVFTVFQYFFKKVVLRGGKGKFLTTKEYFTEFEKLLKVCQNLKSILLIIIPINILEYEKELLRILIRSAPTNLREIRFFDNFKFL